MTPAEFIEKYHGNPEITIAFGDNYIVAYRKKDYSEVEKIDLPHAGAIAMRLLYEMVAPNIASTRPPLAEGTQDENSESGGG